MAQQDSLREQLQKAWEVFENNLTNLRRERSKLLDEFTHELEHDYKKKLRQKLDDL